MHLGGSGEVCFSQVGSDFSSSLTYSCLCQTSKRRKWFCRPPCHWHGAKLVSSLTPERQVTVPTSQMIESKHRKEP